MKVRIVHSPYKSGKLRRYDDGGDMSSEIEGLRSINEGGSHEENPLGGVPQGYADDGGQNLVEEGEVVYDDYVYSDRLSPSLRELDSVSLPKKYGGRTFAEIAKKLSEEAEERPNDPISQSGLDSNMGRLRDLQEEHKAQREAERQEAYNQALADVAAAQYQQQGYQQRLPDEVIASMQPGLSETLSTGGIDGLYAEPEEHQGAYGMHLYPEGGDNKTRTSSNGILMYSNAPDNNYDYLKDDRFYWGEGYIRPTKWSPYDEQGNLKDDAEDFWKALQDVYNYNNSDGKYTFQYYKDANEAKDALKDWIENYSEKNKKYDWSNFKDKDGNWDLNKVLEFYTDNVTKDFKDPSKRAHAYNLKVKSEQDAEEPEQEQAAEHEAVPAPQEESPAPAPEGEPEEKKEEDTKPEPYEPLPEWMRYAPIAGSALGAMNAFLTPADHTVSNAMRAAADLPVRLATYRTNNDYQRFMPYDTDYYKNQVAAQANANRAAAAQLGAGRGNAALLMTQANRDALKYLGAGLLQAQKENDERRLAVANYNHGINQENSQGLYSASAQNATLRAARDQKRAELLNLAYKRLGEENDAVTDARSAALTNLATNLGTLGTSNYTQNFYGSMPTDEEKLRYNYTVSPLGVWIRGSEKENGAGTVDLSGAKITTQKYGGRLSHKYCSLRPRRRK